MYKTEFGIDTLSYYYTLTAKQKDRMLSKLKSLAHFKVEKQDYWEQTYTYLSDYYAEQGVKLIISRCKGSRWGLLAVLHPALILGNIDRSKLYQPGKKEEYKGIIKQVSQMLEQVNIPCSVDDMTLYRADVTVNLIFGSSAMVDEYIRIMKKNCLLPHYKSDKFREYEHKTKNCKTANQHSCKQVCKSAAFFTYDKTAQLEMIGAFPDTLIGKRVLCMEAQLCRRAMKKWAGKDTMEGSNWQIIKKLGANVGKILNWYLSRLQPASGDYLRYQDAVKIITQVKGKKIRKRMLYLLRKTSDSNTLSSALERLKEKYCLSGGQCRTVLKKFQKLDISPITLANSSEFEQLPGINCL